jgi:hypothetical protein
MSEYAQRFTDLSVHGRRVLAAEWQMPQQPNQILRHLSVNMYQLGG